MKAVYAGSFDPFTNGHLYIYEQAKELFDVVAIVICENPKKKRFTDINKMYTDITRIDGVDGNYIGVCHGLVADYCKENGVKHLIRGLRNTSDYLYEEEVAKINSEIYPELKTVYFRAKDDVISSTMVRLLHEQGRDVSKYLPHGIAL